MFGTTAALIGWTSQGADPAAASAGNDAAGDARRPAPGPYKLHSDAGDGGIPRHLTAIAIPLATISAARVTNLYDLMDAAYDAASAQRVARTCADIDVRIFQAGTGRRRAGRSTVERVNGRLTAPGRYVRAAPRCYATESVDHLCLVN